MYSEVKAKRIFWDWMWNIKRNRGVKDHFQNVARHSWMNGISIYLNWRAFEGSR